MPSVINKIYRLRFITPVRFGTGGSLYSLKISASADTFFSALFVEALRLYGEKAADEIKNAFASGEIKISSLMPYSTGKGKVSYYLPKPILRISDNKKVMPVENIKKQLKSLEYIEAEDFADFVRESADMTLTAEKLREYKKSFGAEMVYDKVSLCEEEPNPYRVATYSFNEGNGLYFILHGDKKYEDKVDEIISSIGISGIGGKTTAGYGKYETQSSFMDENDSSQIILRMIDDCDASVQMALGPVYPIEKDREALKENAFYTLEKRDGFVFSTNFLNEEGNFMKRKSCVLIKEGSCFGKRLEGSMLDLSHSSKHPVWRLAKTIFIGVRV